LSLDRETGGDRQRARARARTAAIMSTSSSKRGVIMKPPTGT